MVTGLACALYVGQTVNPTWSITRVTLESQKISDTTLSPPDSIPASQAYITPDRIDALNARNRVQSPPEVPQVYTEIVALDDGTLLKRTLTSHWQYWSLLPAVIAILLCWIVREPITALSGGILTGALLIGEFNIIDQRLIPTMMSKNAATILLLYLWLLGGLMGMWEKTGASKAFAVFMAKNFVKGPKTAKLIAWLLGIIFFQGGTVSAVLVGTTVRPLADEERVSHEELAFIVDSTSSPIAILLPFNAWPMYVQAFMVVGGVSFLATEADRLAFFFKAVPFNFYAIFAILTTFLISIEKLPWYGKQLRAAMTRARDTGELDDPEAEPVSHVDYNTEIPRGYTPSIYDFFVPLLTVLIIAIGTYIQAGSPQVLWGFGGALLVSIGMAFGKGMGAKAIITGLSTGFKSVVLGALILLLAITIGGITQETGGGVYLVELIGSWIPFWILPGFLALLTMLIAFATGTSWGTFAVALPLALPLAVHSGAHLSNLPFFMLLCFAAILNGAIYGDQCSPISDTTVLSAMTTGCDLMDHVKTQIPLASVAMGLAIVLWTLLVLVSV